MSPTLIVDDRARLVKAFVTLVEEAAAEALAARGRVALAVTGGRDAAVLLPALADARADWTRADVFWGDERAVAASHPDSNYGQIKAAWLDRSTIPKHRVHPMRGDAPDLESAAREYATTLEATLGPAPVFDVFVLGVGPDGHVCSIFPGHTAMTEQARDVVAVRDSPKPPPRRLTLTLPAIERSRLVVVMALGPDKRQALDAALREPGSDTPIAHVFRHAGRVVVLAGRD